MSCNKRCLLLFNKCELTYEKENRKYINKSQNEAEIKQQQDVNI